MRPFVRTFATVVMPSALRAKFLGGVVTSAEMRKIAEENAKLGCVESARFLAGLDTRDPGLRVETGITDPKKLVHVAVALADDVGAKPYQKISPIRLQGERENYKELSAHNDFPEHDVMVVTLACAKGAGVVETLVIPVEEIIKALSSAAIERLETCSYVDAVSKSLPPYAIFSRNEKGRRIINFSADARCVKGAKAGCFEALNEIRGALGIEPLVSSSIFSRVINKFFPGKELALQIVCERHRLKDGDVLRVLNRESLHARMGARTEEGKVVDPARDIELRAFVALKPVDLTQIIE